MINEILVPTDFSGSAAGAFRYAQYIGRRLGVSVRVLHVYHPSFDLSNPYLDVPARDFGEVKQKALDSFVRQNVVPESPSGEAQFARIKTELVVGFAAEEVIAHASATDLIVMGTTGAGPRAMESLFGSVSSFVAQNAHCPVLLVPDGVAYVDIQRLMYASNNASADEAVLDRVLSQLGLVPESIHFVHANEAKGVLCRVAEVVSKELLRGDNSRLPLQFVTISCDDILQGLNQYAGDHEIDLIVMGTVHRNFIERLFHRSLTRNMIYHSRLPVLVLHYDD